MNLKNQIFSHNWSIYNFFTISFCLAILLTAIQIYALIKQNKKIKDNKSSESLSLTFFTGQFFLYFSYIIYGLTYLSPVIIINNFLCFFFLPIIYNIIKYERKEANERYRQCGTQRAYRKTKKETIATIVISLILTATIIFIKNRDFMIILVLSVIALSALPQFFYITIKKDLSNIEPKYIRSIAISSFTWLSYGIIAKNYGEPIGWGFLLSSALTLVFSISVILIYRKDKFRRRALTTSD